MESDSASDHDEDSKQRSPTTKVKANKVKHVVTYNKKVSRLEKKPQNYLLLRWRNSKHYLYAKFIKNRSKDPKENLLKPPKDYPFIKKEDWKVFVSHRVTKKWEEKSMKAKNTHAHHKYHHHLSRKRICQTH
uniref:Uncharacterized protein n=1 Tax=Lactuca sativa TaxID=4236 RepID=A0A9R1WJ87_LACSA|nr:hypothetical protein LSAT_V11C200056860 [Lactuca sativa]